MLTVIMECRNQEPELAQTLAGLVVGAVEGLVSDVIVLDHGSSDGSSRVADAAGCRFHVDWDMKDIVRSARGEWILLIEPGSRLHGRWIEEIHEYIALNKRPARFTVARPYRMPFYKRIVRSSPPLEQGFLLPKDQALTIAKSGTDLGTLARGHKPKQLLTEMIPSWVARRGRALAGA